MRHLGVFIHGMMLEEHPPLGKVQYDKLWAQMLHFNPSLGERLPEEDHLYVEWGKFESPVERAPDRMINLAQEFMAEKIDPERVRARPGANNMILPDPKEVPLSELAWTGMVRALRETLLMKGIGDLVYYCGLEGRRAVQYTVFSQLLNALEPHRHYPDRQVCLHFFTHSMGGMIAHDFLRGLFSTSTIPELFQGDYLNECDAYLKERWQFWREHAGEKIHLGSLITLGSPLPLMLMAGQQTVEQFAARHTLEASGIGITEETSVVWKNFYDRHDILAFPIRGLFGDHPGVADIEVVAGRDAWSSSAYWKCPDVARGCADAVHRRTRPPSLA